MNIDFTNLDFFEIKQQMIDYYQSKTEFQDVNFLGSTANLLIDSAAYAIHTMAIHANFAISETFLDSVLLRSNALSRAKELGYDTATLSSALMRVTMTVTGNNPSDGSISLPRGTLFESGSSSSIPFVNLDGVELVKERDELGSFIDETIRTATFDIWQGKLITNDYVVSGMDDFEPYYLREKNIDGTQIRVSVDGVDWARYDGTFKVEPETEMWYVQENSLGQIEVYFGNDIIGKKPTNGQAVKIEYLTTLGEEGNDVTVITYPTESSNSAYSIEVVENSIGGAPEQSAHRIAHTAPILKGAQKRAVIENDYIGLLKDEFSWIEALNVWGGEKNNPPQYGRVFVAIKPKGAEYLAPSLADQVKTRVIEKYNVLGIIPEIVEPDYTFIKLSSEVYWMEDQTEKDASALSTDFIQPAIVSYFTEEITDFDRDVLYSRLVADIDDSHKAISNNDTSMTLYKAYKPLPFSAVSHEFSFFNAVEPSSVRTDEFTNVSNVKITLRDNGNGLMDEYRDGSLVSSGVGFVNYETGKVTLSLYEFEVVESTEIILNATPVALDIKSGVNNLLILGSYAVNLSKV